MTRAALVTAVALAVLGAACTAPVAQDATPSPSASLDLEELRISFGVPDCPATDPAAAAVPDGLPVTELPCLGSQSPVNLAGLDRKATVINFWAQWCAPCREEAPYLREAAARHPEIAFLGVNYGDPQADWALEFAGLVEWPYPHVQDMDETLRGEIGIPGLPTTLFVDQTGRIVGRHIGVLESPEQLNELIEQYLGFS
ncbi:MAG: TlpA family protein disulfide reductase [Arachnia sp.]